MSEPAEKKARTDGSSKLNEQKLKVVIVGGGNSSHVLAGLASNAGHHVTMLTRRPGDWSKTVTCQNQDPGWLTKEERSISGDIALITSDASVCVPEADVIVLGGIPVHFYRSVLKDVCPHIKRKGVLLGSLCAYGGFSWLCAEAMGAERVKTICLFGAQSIPWTCGTLKYGSEGVVFGAKRHLHIALENEDTTSAVLKGSALDAIQGLLRNENVSKTDFLVATLWPNNPLFHPTVLFGIFSDWDMKTPYKVEDVPVRIYADVTKRSASYIQKMDDELQLISKAVRAKTPGWDEEGLCRPLKDCLAFHYGELIEDTTDMYSILRTNSAYAKHKITYTNVGEGLVIPDIKHKFFTTDLPFGLVIYKDLALMLGIETPVIDELIYWNQKMVSQEYLTKEGTLTGKDIAEAVLPSKYGLKF